MEAVEKAMQETEGLKKENDRLRNPTRSTATNNHYVGTGSQFVQWKNVNSDKGTGWS